MEQEKRLGFEDVKGIEYKYSIKSVGDNEHGWRTDGELLVTATFDGEVWGEYEHSVVTTTDTLLDGVGVVVKNIAAVVSDPQVLVKIYKHYENLKAQ